MSEQFVIMHSAPTLAGMKTGSLFTCPYENKEAMAETLRRWNMILKPKGLCVLPLRFSSQRALIYLYRKSALEHDLQQKEVKHLLQRYGYCLSSIYHCIVHLAKRIQNSVEFPHEIGCFLGYPLEDVCGFIENKPCKCIGCWKVYGDVVSAQKQFDRYDKCTKAYQTQLSKGCSMDRLLIAK